MPINRYSTSATVAATFWILVKERNLGNLRRALLDAGQTKPG